MAVRRIVVLGGGISGLSLAWFLKKQYGQRIHLTLLEKTERVGGWIKTVEKEGFLFEQGPRGCRPFGAGIKTLQLIEDLHLNNEVITADTSAKSRYLYANESLQKIPESFAGLIFSPFFKDIFFPVLKDLTTCKGTGQDESIYAFIKRRFGHQVAEKFIDPLILGIFAGDIRQLSIQSCFSKLYEWEQTYGSVLKGFFLSKERNLDKMTTFSQQVQKCSLFSFKQGMETLTKALEVKLLDQIKKLTPVTALKFEQDQISIQTTNGDIQADHVFSTLAPHAMADLLFPVIPKVSTLLQSIPSQSIAVVNIGYRDVVLKKQGFGYLVPSKEKQKILGMTWDSCTFPQQNKNKQQTRLTVMMKAEQSDYMDIASEALKKHLNIAKDPDLMMCQVSKKAIPQYLVGHRDLLMQIKTALSSFSHQITLLGHGFHGISVNECIANSYSVSMQAEDQFAKKSLKL